MEFTFVYFCSPSGVLKFVGRLRDNGVLREVSLCRGDNIFAFSFNNLTCS